MIAGAGPKRALDAAGGAGDRSCLARAGRGDAAHPSARSWSSCCFSAVLRIGPEGLRIGRAGLMRAGLRGRWCCNWPCRSPWRCHSRRWGLLQGSFALGAVLFLCAAPLNGGGLISRSWLGGDPAPAAAPDGDRHGASAPSRWCRVFALAPAFGGASEVIAAVLRLLAVIAVAAVWRCCSGRAGIVCGAHRG